MCASPISKCTTESRGISEVLMSKDKTLQAEVGDKQVSFPSIHPDYPVILYR